MGRPKMDHDKLFDYDNINAGGENNDNWVYKGHF